MQRTVESRYQAMGRALNATGRPILFQMCEWGVSSPWTYGSTVRAAFSLPSLHTLTDVGRVLLHAGI